MGKLSKLLCSLLMLLLPSALAAQRSYIRSKTILPDTMYRYLHDGDTIYHIYYVMPDTAGLWKSKPARRHYVRTPADSLGEPFLNLIVKTNAIYDAALMPTGGLELSFGKRWSAGVDGFVAWMQNRKHNTWYENYGFDLYGRYWFGRQNTCALRGFHAGVYAGTFTYDRYWGHKGYQCDKMFHSFRFGGEFGYSTYLTRRDHNWRIDFYGCLGVFTTRQDVYREGVDDKYYFVKRRHRTLPDFSRFGVTIGYMFGQRSK